jgi:hypothetical protein
VGGGLGQESDIEGRHLGDDGRRLRGTWQPAQPIQIGTDSFHPADRPGGDGRIARDAKDTADRDALTSSQSRLKRATYQSGGRHNRSRTGSGSSLIWFSQVPTQRTQLRARMNAQLLVGASQSGLYGLYAD